jgi:uncharacterized protein YhbP (UPF0306 family)
MAKRDANEIIAPDSTANSTEQLRKTILDYLAAHNAMTIASCDKNVPWASAVFYASDGLDLYFISNPRSRHGTNIAANSWVSAAVHEDPNNWKEIRGIQLEGVAELVRSPKGKIRFWEIYRKKFPFVDAFFKPGPLREIVQAKIAGVRLYRIVPRAVWHLDNRLGFGHREQLPL